MYIHENNVVVEVLIVVKIHSKLFYTLPEFRLDQWNARHVMLFVFDNHAFVFFSGLDVLRCMMNASRRYIPLPLKYKSQYNSNVKNFKKIS